MDNEMVLTLLREIATLKVEVNHIKGKSTEFESVTKIHIDKKDEINRELELLKTKLKLQ
jgi:hypothetical protein